VPDIVRRARADEPRLRDVGAAPCSDGDAVRAFAGSAGPRARSADGAPGLEERVAARVGAALAGGTVA
jgi:hypothetical protein